MTKSSNTAGSGKSSLQRTVQGATTAAGLITVLSGDAALGGLLIGVTAQVGDLAEGVKHALEGASARVLSLSASRIRKQILDQNLNPDSVEMDDTFRAALGALSDAETDAKRQILEQILVNSARFSGDPIKHVEAQKALVRIAALDSDALFVFAALAQLQGEHADWKSPPSTWKEIQELCPFEHFILYAAIRHLHEQARLIVVEVDFHDVGEDQPEVEYETAKLNHIGRWLAKWIRESAPTPGAST